MKNISLIILLLILCRQVVLSQTINDLEGKLDKSQLILKSETSKLDSLKTILNARVKMINREKNKRDFDKDYVARLMSGSIIISDHIDSLHNKIEILKKHNERIKAILSTKYGGKIDSLQKLERSGKPAKEQLKEIRSQIYSYIEKRIYTAPDVSLLSFNPDKIVKINPDTLKDPSQRKIYGEYITSALDEVNDRLKKVDESYKEVRSIVALQKKTSKFIEETEFATVPPQRINESPSVENYPSTATGNGLPTTPTSNYGTDVQSSAYKSQAQSYNLLLWQLKRPFDSYNKLNSEVMSPELTMQQYFDILRELRERLSEYKLLLTHKAGIN